jgi:hypothetical protein
VFVYSSNRKEQDMTEKGWYLVAVGVLALSLNNGLTKQPRNLVSAVTNEASGLLQNASTTFSAGTVVTPIPRVHVVTVPTPDFYIASIQADMNCRQAQMARMQAEFARLQAERMRALAEQGAFIRPHGRLIVPAPAPILPDDGTI